MPVSPAQLRAARALLDWSQQELAERAGINWTTVRDFESGRRQLRRASLDAILEALSPHVAFFGDEEASFSGGAGVRLRTRRPKPPSPTKSARGTTAKRKRPTAKSAPISPDPADDFDERLDQLTRRMEERQKRLEALMKQLKGEDDAT
jgi:transcriptional regulator with XRE-family HTH domain